MSDPLATTEPIQDLDAFLAVVDFCAGPARPGRADAATPLGDAGLDSLGVTLVWILLAERGAELTDDDWIGLRTVGDLWETYGFRLTNPARP